LPKSERLTAVIVDSPGGDIFEADKIARFVGEVELGVPVLSGGQCSSACFLIFAAAVRRYMAPDALIGIHSVSDNGQESILRVE
jgi:hypothetical protein